jgi:hypothetical protein
MMALVTGIRKWDHLLGARKFKVCTDSSPLTHMLSLRMTRGIIQRWLQELASYQFHVQHKPGKLNSNADGISRSPQILSPPTPKDLREIAEFEQYICILEARLLEANNDQVNSLHVIEQDNGVGSPPVITLGHIDIPDWVRQQDEDEDLKEVKSWVRAQVKPSKEDIRMKNRGLHCYRQLFELLFIDEHGILRVNFVNGLGEESPKICVPYNLLGVVMFISHEMDLAGHFAASSSVVRAKTMFYSSTLNRDLTNLVAVCAVCLKKQRSVNTKNNVPHSREAGYVGHYVNSDLVGIIKPDINGYKYICSLQDGFSRLIHLIPLKDKSAMSVASAFYQYGCTFGFPDVYRTDNGTEFNNKTVIELCKLVQCQKVNIVAYNPQSNPVERFHRDLGRMIRALLPREDNHWCTLLPTICSAYNSKVNESTGHTPNMVFFGREMNLPSDFLISKRSQDFNCPSEYVAYLAQRYRRVQEAVQANQAATIKRNSSLYTPPEPFAVGDLVNLFSRLSVKDKSQKVTNSWVGPFKVARIVNANIVEIVTLDALKLFPVNINGLQRWRGVGPALPHPDHHRVVVPEELELVDVPLGNDLPAVEVPGEGPDDDEDILWEPPLGASVPHPVPPPVEVPETPPVVLMDQEVLMPELPSPPALLQGPIPVDIPDEFVLLSDEEGVPDELPLGEEPEEAAVRPRRDRRLPEHFRDFDMNALTRK